MMMLLSSTPTCVKVLTLLSLSIVALAAREFDFFYFVQQWPGSYCNTKRSCCYPTTGSPPTNFSIHGLWPNYNEGSYPSNCDKRNPFDPTQISDLRRRMNENWPTLKCPSSNGLKFWKHEWTKHGTCSESILDQHSYFQATLDLKDRINLLQILSDAGIEANGHTYSLSSIREAIEKGIGYTPGIQCNTDASGNKQLLEVYICVDKSGKELTECPIIRKSYSCGDGDIEFPPFGSPSGEDSKDLDRTF